MKYTYWAAHGVYLANDCTNLSSPAAKWYAPARILNISLIDYIKLLQRYNATGFCYYPQTDFLYYHWTNENDAKRFCAYINKELKYVTT